MGNEIAMQELNTVQDGRISSLALITNDGNMQRLMSLAKLMASSKVTMPKHLQGSEGDCMAIAIQAMNWGMNPFAVAQKTHLVNGTLGYEAQLVNAVIGASGAIIGAFEYEYRGEGALMECRVGAVLRGKKQITWGEWLCIGLVTTKNSPVWKTNPKQQLGYLQVKNWARAYCPGAILGVYTTDELIEQKEIELNDAPEGAATSGKSARSEPEKVILPEMTLEALAEKYATDTINADGEVTKFSAKSKIQQGDGTAQKLIDFLAPKYALTDEVIAEINSWEAK